MDQVPAANVMRLLPDAQPPSGAELAAYFEACGQACLAHLGHRPLTLVRCLAGTTFFHKGPLPPVPAAVHRVEVRKADGSRAPRLWVDDVAGLLGLVEIGAVELHPWNARVEDIDRPDRLVFDLDPDQAVPWGEVTAAALALRTFLAGKGLDPWPKTTGGKGLHLIAPLPPGFGWAEVRRIARALAEDFAATAPDRLTAVSGPNARRGGLIFVDYLRNGRGQSAIGAMSPRALHGGLVSTPLTWAEVEAQIRPETFTLRAVAERCRRRAPG